MQVTSLPMNNVMRSYDGESGMDLYAKFKELSPDLKVVFMSGYSEEAVQEKNHIEPDAMFIQKPFTPGQLGEHIREVLGKPEDIRTLEMGFGL